MGEREREREREREKERERRRKREIKGKRNRRIKRRLQEAKWERSDADAERILRWGGKRKKREGVRDKLRIE